MLSTTAFARLPLHIPLLSVSNQAPKSQSRRPAFMSFSAPKRNVLVTFDIDGTLLGKVASAKRDTLAHRAAVSGHKDCIQRAVKAIFGVDCCVDSVPHAGSTDMEIVRRMCEKCGVSDAEVFANMERVVKLCDELIPGLIEDTLVDNVLPGVSRLLVSLKEEHNVYMGLVTGNFSKIGWAKMRAAGLGEFLSEELDQPSAFGSDRRERKEILALAVERAEARGFKKEVDSYGTSTNVFHVGDAVADMAAASFVRGRGVGVLTGAFTEDDLAPEKPFTVLRDLSDTEAVLGILKL